jgi:hypothetical protein
MPGSYLQCALTLAFPHFNSRYLVLTRFCSHFTLLQLLLPRFTSVTINPYPALMCFNSRFTPLQLLLPHFNALLLSLYLASTLALPCFNSRYHVLMRFCSRFTPLQLSLYVTTPLWAKCEGEAHTPKSGNLESSGTPENLELKLKGQNTLHWGVFGVIRKVLKCTCLNWPRIGHLDIYNPSYGQKKGRESNWQFYS